jgi:hypothetical protein
VKPHPQPLSNSIVAAERGANLGQTAPLSVGEGSGVRFHNGKKEIT